MLIDYTDTIEKGRIGEQELVEWFQENGIKFLYLDQSPLTFAKTFTDRVKRPDFLVILDSIGTLAVDAKNCTMSHGCLTLQRTEIKKAIGFEVLTRLPFWFVFRHTAQDKATWYWMSALQAIHAGTIKTNSKTGDAFQAIRLQEFIAVRDNRDIREIIFPHFPPKTSTNESLICPV